MVLFNPASHIYLCRENTVLFVTRFFPPWEAGMLKND